MPRFYDRSANLLGLFFFGEGGDEDFGGGVVAEFFDRPKIEELYFTGKFTMTIAEQIYKLVQNLPQDQASQVLTFTEFVFAKHLNTSSLNSTQSMGFKASLARLYDLTQDAPAIDPVAWIEERRQELNERSCF